MRALGRKYEQLLRFSLIYIHTCNEVFKKIKPN